MDLKLTDLYTALTTSAYKRPEATAIVAGGKHWSFHEFLMNVDRCADMFWEHGLRKGDKIAIALRNSVEVAIANYAAYKIGAISVPINFMISKAEELKFILGDSSTKIVVTQAEYLRNYSSIKKDLPALKYIFSIDEISSSVKELNDEDIKLFWPVVNKSIFNSEILSSHTERDDLAMLLYTSGTTGNPKGVMLTHYNLISNINSAVLTFKITEDDVMLCILPMFHTFAWVLNVALPLTLGLKVVIVANITPASGWLHLMGKEKVTIMLAVPQLYSVLAKEAMGLKRLYLQYWAFRKIRFAISGAAPLNKEIHAHFENRLSVPLLEGYGLTETSPVLSVNTENNNKVGSVGYAMPDIKIKIADDDGNELARNEEGEICVKGPNVFQGYFNNPEGTKDAFDKDGWFKTGDVGIVDDEGFIFIRDRKKDMIIVKGLKVFSAQVEHTIMQYPGIEECAVIGVPDGKGGEFIKLYVAKKKAAEFANFNEADFRKFLKKNLDNYKRPRDVEFMEELPKNALRKILKKDLRKDAVAKLQERLTAVPAGSDDL